VATVPFGHFFNNWFSLDDILTTFNLHEYDFLNFQHAKFVLSK